MSVFESAALLTGKDNNGDKRLLYPITRADCVDGLEELIDEKISGNDGHTGGGVTSWADLADKPFYNKPGTIFKGTFQDIKTPDGSSWDGAMFLDDTSDAALVEGQTYTYTWDGVEYTSKCFQVSGYEEEIFAIGNSYHGDSGEDNGQPVSIWRIGSKWMAVFVTPPADLTISGAYSCEIFGDVLKQLDDKYLKMLECQSGDKNNLLPTATATSQFASSFGVYGMNIPTTQEMLSNWHGNSDTPIEGNIFVEFDGVTYECAQQRLTALDDGIAIGNCTMFGGTGNDEPFMVTVAGARDDEGNEIYVWMVGCWTDTEPTKHTVWVYQKTSEDKYVLKEEYLPDSTKLPEVTADDDGKLLGVSGGEWTVVDAPVGSGIYPCDPFDAAVDIIPGQELDFTNDGTVVWGITSYVGSTHLVAGQTYKVHFDGKQYTCVAKRLTDILTDGNWNEYAVVIGNLALIPELFGDDALDTGEPFHITDDTSSSDFSFGLVASSAGTHAVGVWQITQLDNKYLSILDLQSASETEFLPSYTATNMFLEMTGGISAFMLIPETTKKVFDAWMANQDNVTVVYDNVTYNCAIQEIQGMKAVGNLASMGGTGNNEPFVTAVIQENTDVYMWIIMSTVDTEPTEHTVRVYQSIPEKCLLKEEYLPDSAKLPAATSEDNNKFLRLVDGVPTWVALTDVSQEGA